MLIKYLQILPRKHGSIDGDSDSKARYTHELITEVGTRICWPRKRDIGVSYCRMLLYYTMLNDDAFRTGVAVTPLCSCNVKKKTVMHFLFDCTNYREARSQLSDIVNDIWMSVSSRGFVQSKEHLMLSTQCKDIIRSQRKHFKGSSFCILSHH